MKFKKTTDKITGSTRWLPTHDDSSWRSGMVDSRLPFIQMFPAAFGFQYQVTGSDRSDFGCFQSLSEAKALVRSIARDRGVI